MSRYSLSDETSALWRAVFLLANGAGLPASASVTLCFCQTCYMHAMNRAHSKPIHSREDEGLSDSDLEKITIAEYFLESVIPLSCRTLRDAAAVRQQSSDSCEQSARTRTRTRRAGTVTIV